MMHDDYMDFDIAKVGDTVHGDFIEEVMCCLPPACERSSCSQLGEPYSHRRDEIGNWRPTYLTWHLSEYMHNDWSHESIWVFDGACFRGKNNNLEPKFDA